jgi:hypothetical protein
LIIGTTISNNKKMSRHIQKKDNLTIAYGFDPTPIGGYFFQVYKDMKNEIHVYTEGYEKD